MEARLGGEENLLVTKFGVVWKLLRPSWCQHPQASLNGGQNWKIRLLPGRYEALGDLNSCVGSQSFQKEDLVVWFKSDVKKDKSDARILADYYVSTTVNLATLFGFFSRLSSLESLELLV